MYVQKLVEDAAKDVDDVLRAVGQVIVSAVAQSLGVFLHLKVKDELDVKKALGDAVAHFLVKDRVGQHQRIGLENFLVALDLLKLNFDLFRHRIARVDIAEPFGINLLRCNRRLRNDALRLVGNYKCVAPPNSGRNRRSKKQIHRKIL